MELRNAKVLGFGVLQLGMHNRLQISGEDGLVQGDLLGDLVLNVPNTAVSEFMQLYFEFPEDFLYFGHDLLDGPIKARQV